MNINTLRTTVQENIKPILSVVGLSLLLLTGKVFHENCQTDDHGVNCNVGGTNFGYFNNPSFGSQNGYLATDNRRMGIGNDGVYPGFYTWHVDPDGNRTTSRIEFPLSQE